MTPAKVAGQTDDPLGLKDRVAFVTGSGRGFGLTVARLLSRRGAAVALFDLDSSAVTAAASEIRSEGGKALAVGGDVTDEHAVQQAVALTVTEFGALHILVNNAGIAGSSQPLWEIDLAEWQHVMNVNLAGAFLCCKSCVPHMRAAGWGRIVNVASTAGKEGNPNASHYSASKAAVIALTKSLGKELARESITVNAVAPTVMRTDMVASVSPERLQWMVERIPMGRLGEPAEVAELVAFLASNLTSFTTASVFDASGGRATY